MVSSIGLRSYRRGTLKALSSRHPSPRRSLTTRCASPFLAIEYRLAATARAHSDTTNRILVTLQLGRVESHYAPIRNNNRCVLALKDAVKKLTGSIDLSGEA